MNLIFHETHNLLDNSKTCFIDLGDTRPSNVISHGFQFVYNIDVNDENWSSYRNGWEFFGDISSDCKRMGIDFKDPKCAFKLYDNSNYRLCATYAPKLVFPKVCSQDLLEGCSNFRTKKRLPAMSYFHAKTQTSLWRCSQCQSGITNSRCSEDELMLDSINRLCKPQNQ